MVGSITKLNLNTNSRTKGRFARMVVYVSLNKPLISKVLINGKPQRVEYEFLSLVCFECGRYGYMKETCLNGLLERNAKMEVPQIVSKLWESKTAHKGSDVEEASYGPRMLVEQKVRCRSKGNKLTDVGNLENTFIGSRFMALFSLDKDMEEFDLKNREQEAPKIKEWSQHGYSHIYFGAVRLALNYHGTSGKPVVSRIALLDSSINATKMPASVQLKLLNTKEEPHCVHVPKQIPKQELLKLLPEKRVTNYEQIHQHDQLIRSTKSQIITRADGISEIKFDHNHLKQLPTPPIFSIQMMLKPLQPDDPGSSSGKPKPQPPKVQNQPPTDPSQPPKKDPND
ncbi:hypothetical protein Gohar_009048 [Gossypium harknessii]|uniref:CCHC-type domain-containing protein n=1 Tax=Gossypium harknessii TaxID=34285 RepID=A0A7J9GLK9_9ROSI|nr:hypothetical protein [Gossypium harknessii]